MKGCTNFARRTAISNLTLALNIPCKVHRTEILPNYGIEYVSDIEQGHVQQGKILFKWELISFCVITQRVAVTSYRSFATTLEVGADMLSRNFGKKLPQNIV